MLIRSVLLIVLLGLSCGGFAQQGSAPSAAPSVMRVSGGVMAAQLIKKVDPEFAADAPKDTVVLSVRVGADGNVEEAKALTGAGALRGPAEAAVRQWVYRPYKLNGQPVEVMTTVNVRSAP